MTRRPSLRRPSGCSRPLPTNTTTALICGSWGLGRREPRLANRPATSCSSCALAIGKTVPDIVGEDMDGQTLRLSDYRGKVVVLNFWASWCGPCMGMVPAERALVERMKGRRFVLLGVNGDDEKPKAMKAIAANQMTWKSFWNGGTNGPITDKWNVKSWPTVYVLDENGVIRFKNLRNEKLDEAVLSLVKELEQKQKSAGS